MANYPHATKELRTRNVGKGVALMQSTADRAGKKRGPLAPLDLGGVRHARGNS